jgi:UDP-glucose 4-epimerase
VPAFVVSIPFSLVTPTEEISVEELARLVKERTRSSSPIEFIPYDQAYEPGFEDMMRRVPSVDKLQALTGFRP